MFFEKEPHGVDASNNPVGNEFVSYAIFLEFQYRYKNAVPTIKTKFVAMIVNQTNAPTKKWAKNSQRNDSTTAVPEPTAKNGHVMYKSATAWIAVSLPFVSKLFTDTVVFPNEAVLLRKAGGIASRGIQR